MRTIKVRASFDVEIEVPAEWDDDMVRFYVEENGCPGTGAVGSAVVAAVEGRALDGGECWACARNGENAWVRDG